MNTTNSTRYLLGILVLLFSIGPLPRSAHAILIDVTATGEVNEITNVILGTQFSVGDSMSATLTYDAATPKEPSLILTRGLYLNAIIGGSYSVGSYAGTVVGGNINVDNDDPVFHDGITYRGFASGPAIGSLTPELFGFILNDSAEAILDSLALPLTTSDISGFPDQAWGLSFGGALGTDPPGVFGILTSLELKERVTVPEPTTLALIALGLGGIGYRRHRSRKAA